MTRRLDIPKPLPRRRRPAREWNPALAGLLVIGATIVLGYSLTVLGIGLIQLAGLTP